MPRHTFRGIAMGETVRALRNCDSRTKFEVYRRRLVHKFKLRGYPRDAILAVKEMPFSLRGYYLDKLSRRHIEKPLPLNTLYYRFSRPLNTLLRRAWERVYREPFLTRALPTPPFAAFKNHPCVGSVLSHKRLKFGSDPQHPTLQPANGIQFSHQKFNRPRRRQDLAKAHPPQFLRPVDQTCGNRRCLVCPVLLHPTFVVSQTYQTTHLVQARLHCQSVGVIYLLICRRCGKQYVGQTARSMRERFARHRASFRTAPMSLYSHFLRFHHSDSLDISIVLLAQETDMGTRLTREREWIMCLGTVIPQGLNNRPPTT